MLIEFSVENFRSIRDKLTISMMATRTKSRERNLDSGSIFEVHRELRLLKCSGAYGANASGKSNIVAAFEFIKKFVQESAVESKVDEPIDVEPFRLSTETENKPSLFEMVFLVADDVYRFGFLVNQQQVLEEWLYKTSRRTEKRLFHRTGNQLVLSTEFEEGKDILSKTRRNSLFLSACAAWNGEISKKIVNWFRRLRVISGLNDAGLLTYTAGLIEKESSRDLITKFISSFGVDIKELRTTEGDVEVMPSGVDDIDMKRTYRELARLRKKHRALRLRVEAGHNKYDKNNKIVGTEYLSVDEHESDGTRKLIALAGPLLDTLANQYVLVIDEFDARLHPLVSRGIISLFNSSTGNDKNAQLIFLTHDTNLLSKDLLRRDQVWFVEKDKYGGSHVTSLVEFKVRNDASFEKGYLQGKYGAIPFIGDVKAVVNLARKCDPQEENSAQAELPLTEAQAPAEH